MGDFRAEVDELPRTSRRTSAHKSTDFRAQVGGLPSRSRRASEHKLADFRGQVGGLCAGYGYVSVTHICRISIRQRGKDIRELDAVRGVQIKICTVPVTDGYP
jgi:hypothetical protein